MTVETVAEVVPREFAGEITTHLNIVIGEMIGHGALTESDRTEIEQLMLLRLAKGFKNYDPKRSKPTSFAVMLIERERAEIFSRRMRRGEDVFPAPYNDELLIPSDEFGGATPIDPQYSNNIDKDARMVDFYEILNSLPERQRKLCLAYLETGSWRKAAKMVNISGNSYVPDTIIPQLREAFRELHE